MTNNRLSQVTDRDAGGDTVAATYVYDGRGQRVSKTANGVTTHFVYGLNGELLGEYLDDGTLIKEYIYFNGQPVAIIGSLESPPINDLVIMDNGDPGTSSTGSWTTMTGPQQYGSDYMVADRSAANTYRWTPTLTQEKYYKVSAWWDEDNHNSAHVEYTIAQTDGTKFYKTVSQKINGGTWNTLHIGISNVDYVEVSAANGQAAADAVRFEETDPPPVLGGAPVLEQSVTVGQTQTFFVHNDQLGTPRAVTDSNQTVIWRWDSTPFGDSAPNEDPDGDGNLLTLNMRFPGQYYDAESALNYNYFRDYDPSTGRYEESDPIGLAAGSNTYAYVKSNSVRYVDPTESPRVFRRLICVSQAATA